MCALFHQIQPNLSLYKGKNERQHHTGTENFRSLVKLKDVNDESAFVLVADCSVSESLYLYVHCKYLPVSVILLIKFDLLTRKSVSCFS